MLSLEAGGTGITVSPAGGELVSLRRAGRELIHRAEGAKWRGGAPWLFPATGRNFVEGRPAWRLDGTEYAMPIHGFAMAADWRCEARRDSIVCGIRSGDATRRFYPFAFELRAEYFPSSGGVRAAVEISAAADNAGSMPFSLGNHLTLTLPAGGFDIRTPARRDEALDARGMLTGEVRPVDPRAGFEDRVLGDFPPGECWVELRGTDEPAVRVSQRELSAPARTSPGQYRFVFYGDRERTFLCPEPWYGAPDSLNTGRGTVRLEPGGIFRWEMEIAFV